VAAGPGMPGHCPGELPLNKMATITLDINYFVALASWATSNNDPVTIILINPHQKAILLYVSVKVHSIGS